MRLNNMGGLDGGVQQLELLVHPRSAIAKRHTPHDHVLYLQKGAQVIGRFEPNARNTAHEQIDFFHHCRPVSFRISALARSTYTWTLYKVLPTGAEEAEDSTGFNLRRTVELYQVQLVEVVTRIAEELERTKSKKVTMEEIKALWQRERAKMKTNKAILKAIFPHQNVDMEFQVEVRNGLDVEMEEERMRQEATMYNYEIRRPLDELDLLQQERELEAHVEDNMQLVEQGELYDTGSSRGNTNNQVTLVLVHAAQINQPEDEEDDLEVLDDPKPKQTLNTFMPNRKFSYLSDIIERSHEGSSHYFSSSAGRQTSYKDTQALPSTTEALEEDEVSQQNTKLSKFNTLQEKSHHHHNPLNFAHDDFHRAVTSEKSQNIGDFGPQMSGISGASDVSAELGDVEGGTSGDPFAKWILVFALIVIGVLFFSEANSIRFKKAKPKVPKRAKTR